MQRKILTLLFLFLTSSFLMAQGMIKGTVVDLQTGEPLIAANVLVEGTQTGAATNTDGEYILRNLQPGTYTVRASYIGYQTVTVSNVRVSNALTTEVDFELPPEGIEVGTVEIVADKPLIVKDNTNKIRITSSEEIDALPVRGVDEILGLTPGVVIKDDAVFIRGGRLDEVGFYLEGTNITDPLLGGRSVAVSQDALEEIQVQAGGYTAEFGGANAGIIRQQLKSGGPEYNASVEYITDNFTFQDQIVGADKRLGAYSYGYNETIASLSGPILDQRFRFFFNFNYKYQKDREPQPYPGIDIGPVVTPGIGDSIDLVFPAGPVYGNQRQDYIYAGTINMDFKPILLRFSGTYTDFRSDANPGQRARREAGNVADFLNSRIGYQEGYNGTGNIKLTHILSPSVFYEIQGGYYFNQWERLDPWLGDDYLNYGDSLATAQAVGHPVWERSEKDLNNELFGRYQVPTDLNILGFSFVKDGAPPINYQKNDKSSINVNAALSLLLGDVHSIKLGGDYQQYSIRRWTVGNQRELANSVDSRLRNNPGETENEALRQVLITNGVNNYGYDVLGNELDDDKFFGPKKPVFLGAYVQDKMEFEDLIVNFGLRYDFIDVDNLMFKDPTRPELAIRKSDGEIIESGFTEVPTFSAVSPRLGFSFPVTDRTVFHAQYGKFVQQSRLLDTYQGYYSTGYELRGGFFIPSPVGQNIRPTRTTQYEVGFSQQLTDFLSFDVTGYYKDIKDQVVYVLQNTDPNSPYQSFSTLGNGDFATTKGLELSFDMRRYQRVMVNGSLSFQDARGTGSFPNSNRGIVGAPLDGVTIFNPVYISPLEFNNAIRGNMNIDYRFGPDEGPVALHDFGVSALLTYNSGHPFTRGTGAADLEDDARNRRPVEPLNSSTTPSIFQVDLRVDKGFQIFDKLRANFYVYVINLFDAKNIENVFLRTGSTEDDGFITDPELAAQLRQTYGDQYVGVYKALNIDYYESYQRAGNLLTTPLFYGPPRQIRLGVRLEY